MRKFKSRHHHDEYMVSIMSILVLVLSVLSIQSSTTSFLVVAAAPVATTTTEELFDGSNNVESVHSAAATATTSTTATTPTSTGLLDSLWNTFKQTLEGTRTSKRTNYFSSTFSATAATTTKPAGSSGDYRYASSASTRYMSAAAVAAATEERVKESSESMSSRRVQLLEQTLQEHYTRRLVQSSPHLDDYHYLEIHSENDDDIQNENENEDSHIDTYNTNSNTNTQQLYRQQLQHFWKSDEPIRWTTKRFCVGYSETPDSYWSFQWCPYEGLYQGIRRRDMSLDGHHVLGRYTPWRSLKAYTTTQKVAMAFYQNVHEWFPDAVEYQHYFNGDSCGGNKQQKLDRPKRVAVVVIHGDDSELCINSGQWATATATITAEAAAAGYNQIIASIQEPSTCKYIVHVCNNEQASNLTPLPSSPQQDEDQEDLNVPSSLPSSSENENDINDNEDSAEDTFEIQHEIQPAKISPITESDAKELNQTMQNIHKVMHAYLHQTEATAYQKANPDRTTSLHVGLPPMPASKIKDNLKLIRDMFTHAYDSYMYNAFPASDLKPISCKPSMFSLVKIPGLTLIDSLDTLILMGNYTEFARSVERLRSLDTYMAQQPNKLAKGGLFALNQNVSVFETNIRVLGGLLSAHQMAEAYIRRKVLQMDVFDEHGNVPLGVLPESTQTTCANDDYSNSNIQSCSASTLYECQENEKSSCHNQTLEYWEYDGFLLSLAQDIGDRLLPAFQTRTGIPYGTVNLLTGIPEGETTIASLAGGGTLSIEMELLSRLTGNREYGRAAKLAARALWMRRSEYNLFGKHICTNRGDWTESLSGIGSNSDSFYEYLVKHYILFPDDHDFWFQTISAYEGIHNESRLGEWYGDVDVLRGLSSGGGAKRVFEALMAFYPGMQVLLGELTPAARSLNSFFLVREYLGFLPERFSYSFWKVEPSGGKHFLRPELLESAYFMHRATKGFLQPSRNPEKTQDSSGWQWAADFALQRLEKVTRTECGYASIDDVSPTSTGDVQLINGKKARLFDEMPSFFLSETLKYLYLTFDENNVLHTDEDRDWVFTTEAHPVHFVETLESMEDKKNQLIRMLKMKVQNHDDTDSLSWPELHSERWSIDSSLRSFKSQIEKVKYLAEVSQHSKRTQNRPEDGNAFRKQSGLVEPFLTKDQIKPELDFFDEIQHGWNSAHLTWHKMGNKHSLPRSCENFYASDLLWVRALNGGTTDYADAYISSAQDFAHSTESRFVMLGSIDALAYLGSGVHVSEFYDESRLCPVRDHRSGTTKQGHETTPTAKNKTAKEPKGKERFDMGGELGQFDVSAFAGGTGFYIERVKTGESFITTLIEEGTGANVADKYIMVYASTPDDSSGPNGSQGKTKSGAISFTENDTQDHEKAWDLKRSVIMTDFHGNTFVCKVEIVGLSSDNEDNESENSEEVLATYPCAPALFGPTHIAQLSITGGLSVQANLQGPVSGDEYGCKATSIEPFPSSSEPMPMRVDQDISESISVPFTPNGGDAHETVEEDESRLSSVRDDSENTCKNTVVQVLRRGFCTFQEKSFNQIGSANAEAVIMINSENDELFVMSGGVDDGSEDDLRYPATVLVTGADGIEILNWIKSSSSSHEQKEDDGDGNKKRYSQLQARVTLSPDKTELIEDGNQFSVVGNENWPALRVSTQVLQLFAKGGWGVHASRVEKTKGTTLEWQLYIMQHKVVP